MNLTFEELYDWSKECMKFFNIRWSNRNLMEIETTETSIIAKYKDEEIIWHNKEIK